MIEAPVGKRPLNEINDEIVAWVNEHTFIEDDGTYHCLVCNDKIMDAGLYVSIHDSIFEGCVGGGEVTVLPFPYCPTCEPEVKGQTMRSCTHGSPPAPARPLPTEYRYGAPTKKWWWPF